MSDELDLPQPPDPAWPMYSPGSRGPHTVSRASSVEELHREIKLRRALFPGLVTKGQLTREQAAREIALFVAIADEVEAHDWIEGRFTWHEKVHGLRREINLRRNVFPHRIAKGQLTHEDAQRHLEVMEAVHHLYWIEGFASDDPRLMLPRPSRDEFPAGLMGSLNYSLAVVHRSEGRTAFFVERAAWQAEQAQRHHAA